MRAVIGARRWMALLGVAAVAAACEGSEPAAPETGPAVAAVEVLPAEGAWSGTLLVGQTVTLRARLLAVGGQELPARPVAWSSSDTAVVTVSAAGVVAARGEGTAEVLGTSGGRVGRVLVVVVAPSSAGAVAEIWVTPMAAVVQVGASVQYRARAFDVQGRELFGRAVAWSTPAPAVLEVGADGLVRALRPGYGQVNATIDGVTAGVGVTVMTPEPQPIRYVIVSPGRSAVFRGRQVQLRATTLGETGGELHGRAVSWVSEAPALASVDASGRVRGLAPGTARIRAESEGIVGYATVEVREVPTGPVQSYALAGTESRRVPFIQIGYGTWTDARGVVHPTYEVVRGGTLRFDLVQGTYAQSFVVETYLLHGAPGAAPVASRTVADQGRYLYDWLTGLPLLESAVTPGLVHRPQPGQAGEWLVEQSVLGTASQRWLWVVAQAE